MHLQEKLDHGISILLLEGEIDLHYAPVLRSLLQGKVRVQCPTLILELAQVSFIDSSGLAAIIEYFRDASEYGGVLCLVGMNQSLRTIFEIVRLDQVIPIFATTAEAQDALAGGQVQPPGQALFKRPAA